MGFHIGFIIQIVLFAMLLSLAATTVAAVFRALVRGQVSRLLSKRFLLEMAGAWGLLLIMFVAVRHIVLPGII